MPVDADGSGNSIVLDGKTFAMELHLVHKSSSGDMAVIGAMITEGARNETLGEVFDNLPAGEEHRPEVQVNLAGLFPDGWEAYRYDGSLTTPPCTEGRFIWQSNAIAATLLRSTFSGQLLAVKSGIYPV